MSLRSTVHETDDLFAAQEFFHARGWTDGLPVVPPTETAVRACLDGAALSPDSLIGVEPVRARTITAEKVAINAVMAGCLPMHFPVVVTALAAMLREHLAVAGFTRTDVCRRLQERARIRRREWAEVGKGRVVRNRGDSEYRALPCPTPSTCSLLRPAARPEASVR